MTARPGEGIVHATYYMVLQFAQKSYLALGTVNLAKMIPAMQAWMMTPTIDWRHMTMIATSHCSVVALQREEANVSIFFSNC